MGDLAAVGDAILGRQGILGGLAAGITAGSMRFAVAARTKNRGASGGVETFQRGTQVPIHKEPAAAHPAQVG